MISNKLLTNKLLKIILFQRIGFSMNYENKKKIVFNSFFE